MPRPVSLHNLQEHRKRALIGWIANRMGELLRLESCASGELVYVAFAKEAYTETKEIAEDYLLYLGSCLVDWVMQERDVYLRIKEMRLPDKYHQCLLDVYEEIGEELHSCCTRKQAEFAGRDREEATWQVYRDVIHAVTQQKFLLIREDEVAAYRQGTVICEAVIKERADIPKARDSAKQYLLENGILAVHVMSHLLVISEAVTNILKHAKEGKMTIVKTDTSFNVLVEDSGPGFPLKLLPYTTLMAGYSTKKSMGQGFTLMMKIAQQVVLSTIPSVGTTLILIFSRNQGEQGEVRDS
ncbi:ATP-binding protein [Paenibacillus chartarius]|uniref:ATP-binding protein n=1 Tax=Paenibacillus chartarius TaxID=747481 RepID=A0ABV6DLV1_9BACL